MPRITIGDCQIHYERQGAGFPVLLVSGLGGVAAYWKDQVPALAARFETIAYDHRGIGQSDHVRTSYTVDGMAEDAIRLLDALGIERAHILGHSTGGAIAQILCLEHPQRVASAVIAASWTKADPYFRRLFALRRDILVRLGPAAYLQSATLCLFPPAWITRQNELLRQLEAQALATFSHPDITASRIDAILAFDRTAELGRIRRPVLVVGAEDDTVTPAYFSEELARRIPGAELKMFARGGHCFTVTAAREFNQAVLPFLHAHTPEEPAIPRVAARSRNST